MRGHQSYIDMILFFGTLEALFAWWCKFDVILLYVIFMISYFLGYDLYMILICKEYQSYIDMILFFGAFIAWW